MKVPRRRLAKQRRKVHDKKSNTELAVLHEHDQCLHTSGV